MPERINFTKASLQSLKPAPNGKRYYVYDKKVNGLCLSVTKTSTKSFLVYRKLKGNPIRVTLGRFPDIKIEQARKMAEKILGKLADGKNPIQEKRAARRRGVTLGEVFEDYLETRGSNLSANTLSNYKTIMASHLCDWKVKPMSKISRDMVERKHKKLSIVSATSANRTMRVLRALFNYANGKYENEEGHGLFPDNPVTRLTHLKAWNKESRRQNKIKNSELGDWLIAVLALSQSDDEFTRTSSDYLQFTLLNGLRRREAASLLVTDVDFNEKTFTIRNTKNKNPITLPMSDYTEKLLLRRCKGKDDKYVFTGQQKDKPINDPRKQIAIVRENSGVYFTHHDLRRTFISIAESLDISAYAVKKLVNHSTGGDVTAGYVIMDVERLRLPMQKISDFVLKHAGLKSSSEIVSLNLGKNSL
ncbi:MAG: integrase family protein [Opitutaceae bacterium]|nr:integrase family protein [Opitutaceae bacterium]